jgi:putative ubiquitin-RnfH superfamily antitoxin RatB of RatAB toxin-antitoxin module
VQLTFQLALQTAQGPALSQHSAPAGSTVLEALKVANVDLKNLTVGVWSRSIKPSQLLKAGDRVECYMPLLADPKDARRARVNRSLTQQATKENAANRATNRAMRLKREAAKQTVINQSRASFNPPSSQITISN